jgi:hypothetical protein
MQLLVSLMAMMRAHEESKLKSTRVGDAWTAKRDGARENSEKLTDCVPKWVTVLSEGQGKHKKRSFIPNRDRANLVQRIWHAQIEFIHF